MKLFILFVFFAVQQASAQQKIILLNGRSRMAASMEGIRHKNLIYTNLKGRHKSISLNKVYAAEAENGSQTIYYRQDSAVEYLLTPEQMSWYVKGEQEAIKDYTGKDFYLKGFLWGIGGGVVLHLAPPAALLPPALGILLANKNPDSSKIVVPQMQLLQNEDFLAGYQQRVRTHKVRNTALGAAGGLVFSLVIIILIGKL